jgi:hypothetical protein
MSTNSMAYCSKNPDKVINIMEMGASTHNEKESVNHFRRL